MIINQPEKLLLETMRERILKPEEGWLPFGEMHKKAMLKLGLVSLTDQMNFYRALVDIRECQCIRLNRASLLTSLSWLKPGLISEN